MANAPLPPHSNFGPVRTSVCFSTPKPGRIVVPGDGSDFDNILHELFDEDEARALEQVRDLKETARRAGDEDFWYVVAGSLANICKAQFLFVARPVTHDDDGVALPPVGDVGSLFHAFAWQYDDGHGASGFGKDLQFAAWGCPSAFLHHGKTFICPDELTEFMPNEKNPNGSFLPFKMGSFLGLPLFHEGRHIAHIALVWTEEGMTKRKLSWAFIEMLCRAVEDIIIEHILETSEKVRQPSYDVTRDIDTAMVSPPLSSLKPHARNLSHELRTPMQGVLGMLDVMYANIQEATKEKSEFDLKQVLKNLEHSIEMIQDSSRRAVDAAENVVHAYDLNMGVPEKITSAEDSGSYFGTKGSKKEVLVSDQIEPSRGRKRSYDSDDAGNDRKRKVPMLDTPLSSYSRVRQAELRIAVDESKDVTWGLQPADVSHNGNHKHELGLVGLGLQYVRIRDLLKIVINESLSKGGRPISVKTQDNDHGQIIELILRHDSGLVNKKIQWSVASEVPSTILVHEKYLAKVVSCVFQNAMKFTGDLACVSLHVAVDYKTHSLLITIRDTGPGIPESFQSRIFEPFSREDDSTTRQREGLGLGLLVAKGLSRNLGGDLTLLRTETEGPGRGSEFEIQIPVIPPQSSFFPKSQKMVSSPDENPHFRSVQYQPQHFQPYDSPPHSPTGRRAMPDSQMRFFEDLPVASKATEAVVYGKGLASRHPLTFLVAEDNSLNRKLLVSMLSKLGYNPKTQIYEACDGSDALNQATEAHERTIKGEDGDKGAIDVILMDLWMPHMDGYEAAERILRLYTRNESSRPLARRSISEPAKLVMAKPMGSSRDATDTPSYIPPTIMAVTADATNGAAEKAARAGMEGFMLKPFTLKDLERLVREGWGRRERLSGAMPPPTSNGFVRAAA